MYVASICLTLNEVMYFMLQGISGQRTDGVGETPIERMLINANPSTKGSETEDEVEWDE